MNSLIEMEELKVGKDAIEMEKFSMDEEIVDEVKEKVNNSKLTYKDIEKPIPVNEERPFDYDELFFSVTDKKSVITYANNVFLRVGAYPEKEIIGQLHKLVRHTDMPASVFKIFWDYLLADKPVAAYVKNLAKTGEYYWVIALAFPCDGGYLSVRLKPGSDLFEDVKDIYSQVLKYEKEQIQKSDKRKGMYEAEKYLLELLKSKGFDSYDDFMWSALEREMQNRETHLRQSGYHEKVSKLKVPEHQHKLLSLLGELCGKLESLNRLHEVLMEHSNYMLEFSRSIMLLSMNAQVGSKKLNQSDLSLNVTAENMGSQSVDGEKKLKEMQDNVAQVDKLLNNLNFNIIVSKLQVEMTNLFIDEITDENNTSPYSLISSEKTIELLKEGFDNRLSPIAHSLRELPTLLHKLSVGTEDISRFLHVLRFIHIIGKVEVARMTEDATSFANTFQELIGEVDLAEERIKNLADFIHSNMKLSAEFSSLEYDLQNIIYQLNREKKSMLEQQV